ncbi:hypothetical protein SAMN05216267_102557 [Actinacidiphila rubida]|uniref:Knr4/Smi1-like domain-containing protein n=1 Tax=Actinacidiphila rubida TaxID=310780 RepID=A0A1H8PDP8_9ACTN|nr:SMI1/KNR4 family protein [Actinacidiphila rubida]SEO39758.1 hypothetical protein SAMN05216267_102557 [Actinacidiphila rubida]
MSHQLDRLTRLLPPPQAAVAGPPWQHSRTEVGFDFPSDYRAFVDRYGGGQIGTPGSLRCFVYGPSSLSARPGMPTGFKGFVEWHVSDIAPMFEGCDEDYWGGTVYPMYPEPGGLLTWGENEQGDLFWWLTEGDDPDRWPIVMWARGPATTFRFDSGMVGLLVSMLSGDFPSPDWVQSPHVRWTLTSDWLSRGLNVTAGPAL